MMGNWLYVGEGIWDIGIHTGAGELVELTRGENSMTCLPQFINQNIYKKKILDSSAFCFDIY